MNLTPIYRSSFGCSTEADLQAHVSDFIDQAAAANLVEDISNNLSYLSLMSRSKFASTAELHRLYLAAFSATDPASLPPLASRTPLGRKTFSKALQARYPLVRSNGSRFYGLVIPDLNEESNPDT